MEENLENYPPTQQGDTWLGKGVSSPLSVIYPQNLI